MICVAVMASVWTVAGGRDSPPSAMAPRVPAAVVSDRADAVAKAVPRDASPENVAAGAGGEPAGPRHLRRRRNP